MAKRFFAALALAALALPAAALDFRSVAVPAAILYDSPSQAGKKLYLIRAHTPVEAIVRLEGWVKVRDAEGTLAWIESRNLSERRTLLVTAAAAEIRQSDQPTAPVVAELAKWVAVDYLEAGAPGWVKVKHRDGALGYIRTTQVWGL